MGNEQQKQWMFDNVLFLDPNMPPFGPGNGQGGADGAAGGEGGGWGSATGSSTGDTAKDERRGAKRHTPSHAKLRNRTFRIVVELNGRESEFQIRCMNDPLALIFCDRNGTPLREIPASRITSMEHRGAEVRAEFTDKKTSTAVALTFRFEDARDCNSFCDTVRMMYGIYIHEFGTTKKGTEKGVAAVRSAKKDSRGRRCPVHGNKKCDCNFERPKVTTADLSGSEGEDVSKAVDEDPTAAHSTQFPISINGKAEAGADLRHKDLSAVAKRIPPRAVEWFISRHSGRNPIFASKPSLSASSFIPSDREVGHYIQVRVVRRLDSKNAFIYSIATKGPLTFNDDTAREVLKILTTAPFKIEIQIPQAEMTDLFGADKKQVAKQPFFEGEMIISRKTMKLSVKLGGRGGVVEREVNWTDFVATRPAWEDVDENPHEDLYIFVDMLDFSRSPATFHVAMPNEKQRNNVFHALCFHRLSQNFSGFDRWFQDIERGNFAVLKQRYARLWAEVSWDKYITLPHQDAIGGGSQSTENPRSSEGHEGYGQQQGYDGYGQGYDAYQQQGYDAYQQQQGYDAYQQQQGYDAYQQQQQQGYDPSQSRLGGSGRQRRGPSSYSAGGAPSGTSYGGTSSLASRAAPDDSSSDESDE